MSKVPIQKFLEVFYCLLILSWSISSIVLTAIMFTKMKSLEGNFESLLENWKSDIITDI
jgi:L-lactate permease